MNQSIQESPGRNHDSRRTETPSIFQHDPGQSSVIEHEVNDFPLSQMKI
jgi:hypothetical protein